MNLKFNITALLFVQIVLAVSFSGCGGGSGNNMQSPSIAVCGNSSVEAGEQCDDGNALTEKCDYGQSSCVICNSSCRLAAGETSYCGDERTDIENVEQCDDGNSISGDGCNSRCQIESGTSWARTYGGVNDDSATCVSLTLDGGYVIAGVTSSYGAGNSDLWIMKLDSTGNQTWAKTYGGTSSDFAMSVQQTSDGGYIVAGSTLSGILTFSFWILKLDSTGYLSWQKTHGGDWIDIARSIQQTADGGYIVAGVSGAYGDEDISILKIDGLGETIWSKIFGGDHADEANSIIETTDGNFVIAGSTKSFGAGEDDYNVWVLNIDALGNHIGSNYFGSPTRKDEANKIIQTYDGGFILVGSTSSFGSGDMDIWVIKLSSSLMYQWSQTFGGGFADYGKDIQQTTDGGYIVAGSTYSYGAGERDAWVIKLNASGDTIWSHTYGGPGDDYAMSVRQTTGGGYVVAGGTASYGNGEHDMWVLKLDALGNCLGCVF